MVCRYLSIVCRRSHVPLTGPHRQFIAAVTRDHNSRGVFMTYLWTFSVLIPADVCNAFSKLLQAIPKSDLSTYGLCLMMHLMLVSRGSLFVSFSIENLVRRAMCTLVSAMRLAEVMK